MEEVEKPKLLLRAFETALDDLLRSRRKIQGRIDDLEDQAQASETQRKQKMADLASAVEARHNIEKFAEQFEQEQLDRFNDAYRVGDRKTMNRCARILTDLNGGGSCIQAYVNQHEFFLYQNVEEGNRTTSDSDDELKLDIGLARLFYRIRQVFPKEWDTISAVFTGNAKTVMQTFIQRVFAQSIQSEVERVVSSAGQSSNATFLGVLAVVHEATAELLRDLKQFDNQTMGSEMRNEAFATMLERCFDDIFVPYVEGDRYISLETEYLRSALQEEIEVFTGYVVARKKLKQKGTRIGPLGSELPGRDSGAFPNPAIQAVGQLLSSFGVEVSSKSPTGAIPPPSLPDARGIPSLQVLLRAFAHHLDATARCKELSKPSDLAKNVATLFSVFVDTVGKAYLLCALEL
ncbi:Exocyst complex component 5 [Cladochytrium tenue]|nr:Exocyst complex component 5 [Cladochytrium tenue]